MASPVPDPRFQQDMDTDVAKVLPFPSARTASETVLLVGNPNVGKSLLFKNLTNRYVNVSNFPGTTVEITPRGRLLVRNVAMAFDAYLNTAAGAPARYSRTV